MEEQSTDSLGNYTTVWKCAAPAVGVWYRVIREEWQNDFTLRVIHEIELA